MRALVGVVCRAARTVPSLSLLSGRLQGQMRDLRCGDVILASGAYEPLHFLLEGTTAGRKVGGDATVERWNASSITSTVRGSTDPPRFSKKQNCLHAVDATVVEAVLRKKALLREPIYYLNLRKM